MGETPVQYSECAPIIPAMVNAGTEPALSLRFRINAPPAIAEIVEGEAIIVNLATGNYYSLLDAGAEIWRGIENEFTVGEIVSTLVSRYRATPEEIEKATLELVRQLVEEGLVSRSTEGSPPPETSGVGRVERPGGVLDFKPPILEKYDDMADLILLDPIHDAGPAGWPHRYDDHGDS